jgi:predicted NBD/HSP70 family sugar kinase
MRLLFSRREVARRAAVAAHERWKNGDAVLERDANGLPVKVVEYWAYVINAALAALPEHDEDVGEGDL